MDSIILRIIVAALAVFRLSELFAVDDGPFDVLAMLRGWLVQGTGLRRTVGNGIACRHCNGIWFAVMLAPWIFWSNSVVDLIVIAVAIAGIQSLLVNLCGREI